MKRTMAIVKRAFRSRSWQRRAKRTADNARVRSGVSEACDRTRRTSADANCPGPTGGDDGVSPEGPEAKIRQDRLLQSDPEDTAGAGVINLKAGPDLRTGLGWPRKRYTIAAKTAGGGRMADRLRLMLQKLLTERFPDQPATGRPRKCQCTG